MPSKWAYQEAVMAEAALPGPAKCIALVISTRADVETGVVPEQFSPSLEELAALSGFSAATVKRHLGTLESAGWVKRTRAGVGRNEYALAIPHAGSQRAIAQSAIAQGEPTDGSGRATSVSGIAQSDLIDESERADDRLTVSHPYKDVHQDHLSDPSSSSAAPPRPDVERICQHLAERMVANGCKPPTITHRWRDAARLMLDRDGWTVEQVIRAIDWATADEFWKANILSVPTLRTKYEQLRLAAQRKAGAPRASPAERPAASYHQRFIPED